MTAADTTSSGGAVPQRVSLVDLAAHAFAAHRGGDSTAMEPLVAAVTPLLWHTARSQGADEGAAQDAVQTAWLRLVEHSDRIEDPQAVLQWLLTTTKRESWAAVRRSRRAVAVAEWEELELSGEADGVLPPDLVAEVTESRSALWAHIEHLSPRCQQLLRLIAFVDRPDYAAVSAALGMPIGSIGPTRGRCLGKLRAALDSDPTWAVTS